MQTKSAFVAAGWDFEKVWAICEGTNTPRLRLQIPVSDWACPDGVDIQDFGYLAERWLMSECSLSNNFCGGADVDYSTLVDMADFAALADYWLDEYDTSTPLPLPEAWWEMNEIDGTTVGDSVGEHDGQSFNIAGNPWIIGQSNNAVKLDGVDDYVDVFDYAGITGTTSRTCTAWIKANSIGKEQVIL